MDNTLRHDVAKDVFRYGKTVTHAEVQFKSQLSYRETSKLLEYSVKRGWLVASPDGTYTVKTRDFSLPHISQKDCKELVGKMNLDAYKVLRYIAPIDKATMPMILTNVDDDHEDMERAVRFLMAENLLVELGGWYHINVDQATLAYITEEWDKIVASRPSRRFPM